MTGVIPRDCSMGGSPRIQLRDSTRISVDEGRMDFGTWTTLIYFVIYTLKASFTLFTASHSPILHPNSLRA